MLIGKRVSWFASCVLLLLLATGRGLECALADYSESGSFRDALEGSSMQETMSGPVDRDTSSYGERSSGLGPMGAAAGQAAISPMLSIPANGNFGPGQSEQKQMRVPMAGGADGQQGGNGEQEESQNSAPSTEGLERESQGRAGRLAARRPTGSAVGARRVPNKKQSAQQRAPAMGPQFPTKEASFGEEPRQRKQSPPNQMQEPAQEEQPQMEQPEADEQQPEQKKKMMSGPGIRNGKAEEQDEQEEGAQDEQPEQESPMSGPGKQAKQKKYGNNKPAYKSAMGYPKAQYNKMMPQMNAYGNQAMSNVYRGQQQPAYVNQAQMVTPVIMGPVMMGPMKGLAYSPMGSLSAPMMNSYRATGPQPMALSAPMRDYQQQKQMPKYQQTTPAKVNYPTMMMQNGQYGAMKPANGPVYGMTQPRSYQPTMTGMMPSRIMNLGLVGGMGQVSGSRGMRRANQRRGPAAKQKKMSPVMMNAMLNKLMSMRQQQQELPADQPEQPEQPEQEPQSPMMNGGYQQKKYKMMGYKKMSMTELMRSPAGAEMLAEMVMQQPNSMAQSMGPGKRAQFKKMMMAAIMKEAGGARGEQVSEQSSEGPIAGVEQQDSEGTPEEASKGERNQPQSNRPTEQEKQSKEEGADQDQEQESEMEQGGQQMEQDMKRMKMPKSAYGNKKYNKNNGAYMPKMNGNSGKKEQQQQPEGGDEEQSQERELPSNGRSAEMSQQKKEAQENEGGDEAEEGADDSQKKSGQGEDQEKKQPEQEQEQEKEGETPERGALMTPAMKAKYQRSQVSRYGQQSGYNMNNKRYNNGNQRQKQQQMEEQNPQDEEPKQMKEAAQEKESSEEQSPDDEAAGQAPTKGGPGGVKGGPSNEPQPDQQQEDEGQQQEKQEEIGANKSPSRSPPKMMYSTGQLNGYGAAPMGMAEPFAFGYKVDDNYGNKQYRKESGNDNGAVKGSYGYQDKSGIYRHVEYVADENGFRAAIKSNEPGLSPEQRPQLASPMMSFVNAQQQPQYALNQMIQPQDQQQQQQTESTKSK